MAILDTERLLKSFRTVIQANLTSKLSDITTEYITEDTAEFGGSVTLETIATSDYFLNSAPESLNTGIYVVIGLQAIITDTRGPAVSKAYEVFVQLGHAGLKNESNHDLIESKLLRYARAIQEVVSERFDSILSGHSLAGVAELPVQPDTQLDTGETLTVSGLVFSATVA